MTLLTRIGHYGAHKRFGRFARPFLSRPYRHGKGQRYAIIFEPNDISYAQVYPFVRYAAELEQRHHIQIRFFNAAHLDRVPFKNIDKLILQLWFNRDVAVFEKVFQAVTQHDIEIIAFLDSFAHNDLRLAQFLDQHIKFYFKKSLFRDFQEYRLPRLGHTNLMDYYQRAFAIEDETVTWDIPSGFENKLRLSPNFFTAPHLAPLFLTYDAPQWSALARPIDLHARLGQKGTPWYSAMRQQALQTVQGLKGLNVVCEGMVDRKQFNTELQTSKACFSPFGYGELCWRDIEAMAYGAVLLKPDMSHLQTLPDLYEAGVTYVPLMWDSADLREKMDWVLSNPKQAAAITQEAFRRVQSYLKTDQFIPDMEPLFTS